jgi:hypothetical protein
MRLGRMLAALAAGESETHALVVLMEIQASRLRARTGPDGEFVTLDKQDRARWDRLLITHGLATLDRAEELGGTGSYAIPGLRRSRVMSVSSDGDPEGGEGAGGVAGVVAQGGGEVDRPGAAERTDSEVA